MRAASLRSRHQGTCAPRNVSHSKADSIPLSLSRPTCVSSSCRKREMHRRHQLRISPSQSTESRDSRTSSALERVEAAAELGVVDSLVSLRFLLLVHRRQFFDRPPVLKVGPHSAIQPQGGDDSTRRITGSVRGSDGASSSFRADNSANLTSSSGRRVPQLGDIPKFAQPDGFGKITPADDIRQRNSTLFLGGARK